MPEKKIKKSKTETIKERAIYVYLPSEETAKRWKQLAQKAGCSISKFVIEHVENSLREEGEGHPRRVELIKQIESLKQELLEVRRENEILRKAYEKLDLELKRYRAIPFLEEGFVGIRKYDQKLIQVLKRGEVLSGDAILEKLGIEPSQRDLVKAVNRQLENLEAYGLIRATSKGWRWVG